MAPGGRGYHRLLTGLRSRLQMKADFLLSHHPGELPRPPPIVGHPWKVIWTFFCPLQGAEPPCSPSCPATTGRNTDRKSAGVRWRTCPAPPS